MVNIKIRAVQNISIHLVNPFVASKVIMERIQCEINDFHASSNKVETNDFTDFIGAIVKIGSEICICKDSIPFTYRVLMVEPVSIACVASDSVICVVDSTNETKCVSNPSLLTSEIKISLHDTKFTAFVSFWDSLTCIRTLDALGMNSLDESNTIYIPLSLVDTLDIENCRMVGSCFPFLDSFREFFPTASTKSWFIMLLWMITTLGNLRSAMFILISTLDISLAQSHLNSNHFTSWMQKFLLSSHLK
jgi:hypothetical protein